MRTPASLLVIFGATGDLAQRMLFPSLYGLIADGLCPPPLRILGTGRTEMDAEGFRASIEEAVRRNVPGKECDEETLRALLQRIDYLAADTRDATTLQRLGERIHALRDENGGGRTGGDIVYHLSTAPRFYAPICEALGRMDLAGPGTRVLLEKPIGHDLASATAINDGVTRIFDEERVFRVDHYLGKEGVQNLLALRFGNALFEPLWNARHVQQVQITVAETMGVEGRGDYYDHSGAMRDMLQNHMLQLLCLTAMEPPARFEPSAVRNEKIKVLRSLRTIGRNDVMTETVAGQYTAGAVNGQVVPGYREELGRSSRTETFVALRAHIDNWRWSGVPFYLRTGKRMPRRTTEIHLQFRAVPHSIFAGARMEPNALTIQLQPEERIELRLMSKTPGLDRGGVRLSEVALDLDMHEEFAAHRRRPAYERLYLDALEGNNTLFVRRDETEAAWEWIDAVFDGWRSADITPKPYPAGTWGPAAAVAMAERHGHTWRD